MNFSYLNASAVPLAFSLIKEQKIISNIWIVTKLKEEKPVIICLIQGYASFFFYEKSKLSNFLSSFFILIFLCKFMQVYNENKKKPFKDK